MDKILLLILDGWGLNSHCKGNAIYAANTRNIDNFIEANPHASLKASGTAVGLPEGIMGNSEVGHMNIGAGRVVYQLNTMIDNKVKSGEFFDNSVLNNAIDTANKRKSKLHLFCLLSDGNVHSNLGHLYAMLELCYQKKYFEVYLHCFTDGRDTLPNSGLGFLKDYVKKSNKLGLGKIATISGRYYAMDRDKRWDRIKLAYDAIVRSKGEEYEDPELAIKDSYDKNITDEFIIPKVITEDDKPVAKVSENDVIVFLNYRADRTRQLTRSFIIPDFKDFEVEKFENLHFVSMSEYDIEFDDYLSVAFKAPSLTDILGEVLSKNNVKQLRLAETEKYAHVTFFFNCGREKPFPLEDRLLVPSPKVASYDLQPEMSALEVKDKLLEALHEDKYQLIVVNFANCDMVGHTGDFEAVIKAIETVDQCVGEVIPVAEKNNFHIILTADHGNAEKMLDENGNVFTAHTNNLVPITIKLYNNKNFRLKDGKLGDIAPTILNLLEISVPKVMDGVDLIVSDIKNDQKK